MRRINTRHAQAASATMVAIDVSDSGPSPAVVHGVLLRAMDWNLILAEVERRGHQVCLHQICKFSADRPPAGYPPPADADLPFDAGEDRRG